MNCIGRGLPLSACTAVPSLGYVHYATFFYFLLSSAFPLLGSEKENSSKCLNTKPELSQ